MPITVLRRIPRSRKSRIVKRIRHEQLQREDPEYPAHPLAAKAEASQRAVDAKLAPKQDLSLDPSLEIADTRDATGRLKKAQAYLDDHKAGLRNLKPLLPIMFNLNGQPYQIADHFPFEPFYHVRMCQNMVWKTGRQVSKSTNQAAQGVMYANLEPYFNTLFVTPLFELIRRFSSNYVAPFINLSPIKSLMVDSTCTNSVLQRSFRNQSTLYFSFAFLNADRTRGLNCGKNVYDEIQDMDPSFIPIIRETMSAHKWGGISQYTGTPKTKSNTLHQLWLMSSQAELIIPCGSCKHFNIPHIDHDLDGMMGPTVVKRSISEETPAVVCAKCGKPLNPRLGRWDHLYPDLKWKYSGYHVPQCVMPMHYANEEKWGVLIGKREGFGGTTPNVFYNEVCGEAYDTGAALITETDLRRAAILPWENTLDAAKANFKPGNYIRRIIGVDWGGGGEDMVSLTSVAVLGQLPDGKLDVIYGWRSRSPHAHVEEAKYILYLLKEFRCSHLAHDMQGAGTARETIIKLAGFPENLIIPLAYVRLGVGPMIKWVPYNESTGQRSHHRLDKTRSLVNTAQLIKYGHIRFFQYDYKGVDQPGMMNDFLSLTEDYIGNRSAAETYTIIRDEKAGPDDFANAVNYAACAIFHQARKWPDVAEMVKVKISPRMLAELHLPDDFHWE